MNAFMDKLQAFLLPLSDKLMKAYVSGRLSA